MRLNWLGYNYRIFDGYGRYGARMVQALRRAGVDVTAHFAGAADAPGWMQEEWGVYFNVPTISCLPPYYLRTLPKGSAPHWLLAMTEGSECPDGWADIINKSGVSRVIVPCQHNAEAFASGGVEVPISVIHGGTDPEEFPLRPTARSQQPAAPYTFLALADRGKRKGWSEVYDAFFAAFGTAEDVGPSKVRLVIKCRPSGNDLIDFIVEKAPWIDPRLSFDMRDVPDMREVYAQADCFVIPSRSEGWGMPHREAAMMGIPVITQAYSGMDDGHTHEWAIVVEKGRMEPVETLHGHFKVVLLGLAERLKQGESISDDEIASLEDHARHDAHIKGQWRVVDRDELAKAMYACYDNPASAESLGWGSAAWLRANQTWLHSAQKLLALMQEHGALEPEREFA